MTKSKKGARRTPMHSTTSVLQQQQQPPRPPLGLVPGEPIDPGPDVRISRHLCVPADQEKYLPRRRRTPQFLPAAAPLPRQGEVLYLSSSSAWGVELVIHEWLSPVDLRVEVWITHVGSSRQRRPTGFQLTQ